MKTKRPLSRARLALESLAVLLALSGAAKAEDVSLAWIPAEGTAPAGYVVHWGPMSRAYDQSANVGAATAHVVSGLDPSRTHYFAITSYSTNDGAQSDYSAELVWDNQAPSAPQNLAGQSQADMTVHLTWSAATDDVDAPSYQVFRNGQLIGTATEPVFTDASASALASYTYSVVALDAALNSSASSTPVTIATGPVDFIVDNTSALVTRVGDWAAAALQSGYVGENYLHDLNAGKGAKRVEYRPTGVAPGMYEVFVRYTAAANRASNVPIDVVHSDGTTTLRISERSGGGTWVSLGTFSFLQSNAEVVLRTDATDGYVVADAVRFLLRAPATGEPRPGTPTNLRVVGVAAR